jgi:hypothetical protein
LNALKLILKEDKVKGSAGYGTQTALRFQPGRIFCFAKKSPACSTGHDFLGVLDKSLSCAKQKEQASCGNMPGAGK